MTDQPKKCMTDGSEVTDDHREIDPATKEYQKWVKEYKKLGE